MPPFSIDDLLGKPYVIGGRGPSAYDCAGLVLELQRRQGYDLHIPDTGDSKLADHLAMRHVLRLGWRHLGHSAVGCIVFFPTQAHVGTMLDGRRFLHSTSEFGEVHVSDLGDPQWKRARRSFYLPPVQLKKEVQTFNRPQASERFFT